jgi:hypothetical protein
MLFIDLVPRSLAEKDLRMPVATRCLLGFVFLLTFGMVLPALTQAGATITVTGTGDTIAVDGVVTLREAITSANQNSNVNADVVAVGVYGTDTINFNIPGAGVKTINLTAGLPTLAAAIVIDGYTQGVASVNTLANGDNAVLLIELNGAGAGAGISKVGVAGLTIGSGSSGSTIRGLIINRFSGDGILVRSNNNTITGNFIGTNAAGTAIGTGNANTAFDLVTPFRAGIYIDNGSSNTIGGSTPAARNVVSGNILDNIHISGNLVAGATGNVVQGNFVGVNASGTGILFNSGFWGIEVSGVNASGNTIGGTTAGARNVVGGNGDGIELDDGAHNNVIQGNFFGMGADGVTAIGNRLHGIALRDLGGSPGISGNIIGGTAAGAGNLLANNGSAGVVVFGDPSVTPGNVNNPILGNSIFNNSRSNPGAFLGIDLVSGTMFPTDDGNTPNDFGDGDDGPNKLQNYPVLTSFTTGASTTINGTLNSRNNFGAGVTYRLEFFANTAASQTGFGEGQTFIGFKEVTLGAHPGPFVDQGQNTISFSATGLPAVAASDSITATATELMAGSGSTALNTSEFSNAIAAPTPVPTPSPTPTAPPLPPAQLLNIATRDRVESGDNVLIGGFIIGGGNGTTRIIVRALGPSLANFGVPGVLADPVLELHDDGGNVIASNDNWKLRDADGTSQQAEIEATTIPPTNDLESALIATVTSGNYTIVVRGVAGATGVATVEVYNLH